MPLDLRRQDPLSRTAEDDPTSKMWIGKRATTGFAPLVLRHVRLGIPCGLAFLHRGTRRPLPIAAPPTGHILWIADGIPVRFRLIGKPGRGRIGGTIAPDLGSATAIGTDARSCRGDCRTGWSLERACPCGFKRRAGRIPRAGRC